MTSALAPAALPAPPAPTALPDIDDPLSRAGWRVSRTEDESVLHAEVLRELCDRGLVLHVGGAGTRGIAATLLLVDMLQQQLVLSSPFDGMAVARALQARPLWAAAHLHDLRVQFALAAATAVCEGGGRDGRERLVIRARWPREIYRTSRRRVPRRASSPQRTAMARLPHVHPLLSTRDLCVVDLSELGGAVLLPAGMVAPPVGKVLRRVELELDDEPIVVTDATVLHVGSHGRRMHRVGLRWEGLPPSAQGLLRRWLAAAEEERAEALLEEAG
jgi:hypothetical protein